MRRLPFIFGVLSTVGIGIFCVLYFIAAQYYPGGSNANPDGVGFNLRHNFWCDLMGQSAKNGMPNTAQPIALTAGFILCLSLMFFWYNLPYLFKIHQNTNQFKPTTKLKTKHKIIRYTGISSMFITLFLFTEYHDTVINIAGFLTLIAMGLTFVELYKNKFHKTIAFGFLCLLMACLNYFVYQTSIGLDYLPVLQKISFVVCLSWFAWVGIYNTLAIYKFPKPIP